MKENVVVYVCSVCGHLVFQDRSYFQGEQLGSQPAAPHLWGPTGSCRMCGQGELLLWGMTEITPGEAKPT